MESIVDKLLLKRVLKYWLSKEKPILNLNFAFLTNEKVSAKIKFHSSGIVAGIPFVDELFKILNCSIEWLIDEGATVVQPPQVIATIHGFTHDLLKGESLAINILNRASCIAQQTNKIVRDIKSSQWKGNLCPCENLTPGFEMVENYAMFVGGALLNQQPSSFVVLKSHFLLSDSLSEVVTRTRKMCNSTVKIDFHCSSEDLATKAQSAGVDLITLSHLNIEEIIKIVNSLKNKKSEMLIKVNLPSTLIKISSLPLSNIDFISFGNLTSSSANLADVRFQWETIVSSLNGEIPRPSSTPAATTHINGSDSVSSLRIPLNSTVTTSASSLTSTTTATATVATKRAAPVTSSTASLNISPVKRLKAPPQQQQQQQQPVHSTPKWIPNVRQTTVNGIQRNNSSTRQTSSPLLATPNRHPESIHGPNSIPFRPPCMIMASVAASNGSSSSSIPLTSQARCLPPRGSPYETWGNNRAPRMHNQPNMGFQPMPIVLRNNIMQSTRGLGVMSGGTSQSMSLIQQQQQSAQQQQQRQVQFIQANQSRPMAPMFSQQNFVQMRQFSMPRF